MDEEHVRSGDQLALSRRPGRRGMDVGFLVSQRRLQPRIGPLPDGQLRDHRSRKKVLGWLVPELPIPGQPRILVFKNPLRAMDAVSLHGTILHRQRGQPNLRFQVEPEVDQRGRQENVPYLVRCRT
jgi:hypothetical protein